MDTVVTTFIIIGDHFIIVVLEERGSGALYRSPKCTPARQKVGPHRLPDGRLRWIVGRLLSRTFRKRWPGRTGGKRPPDPMSRFSAQPGQISHHEHCKSRERSKR